MTKIAEQKSYEEYPLLTHKDFERFEVFDNHIFERQAYIKGYDKAMKDFLEKAEEFLYLQLNNGSIECGNIERLIDDFRNYMQDE